MSRWLVTGAAGMLGRDVVTALEAAPGQTVDARTRAQLDLLDEGALRAAVAEADVVVNCAAWTDVDGAEAAEEAARRVNGDAVEVLARECARRGARLLQPSTDYVFSGEATQPYAEDAPPSPVNAYGRTKLVGERAVLELHPEAGYVVRTAWLYATHGRSFVTTMARLAEERPTVDVVDDQVGAPTWTRDLADALLAVGLAEQAPPGVYHATSSGQTSWYGLARATFELLGHDPERVRPTSSAVLQRVARRPGYSVLGSGRWRSASLPPVRDWFEALQSWKNAYDTPRARSSR
ncbi:dTDP-4-dehydrorhamnose reductase [Motilibacter peucedani]|uniref:dTDP-4-dehydrorhamnose reductase n=1 Tax=Motilibacter peucedani TaxID=598650 RepID=A0A420XKS0_9ACTN|nr:dTDP-4-dehydrorhamnose reductase [Motilibacter peucedani]RKS68616.1 dTDP-4-dehydrorhamnose reductase [Motilibacter peucedani]